MSARDLLDLVWIVPALPLLGAVLLLLFGSRIGAPWAGRIATGLLALAFVWSVVMFFALTSLNGDARSNTVILYEWVPAGALSVNLGFLADPLSITWALVVTGVGSVIHLYATGYMKGDPRYPRFFAYFNLFAASMLVLVLADNFLLTFLGWEGVGVCSYLLIGFWFERTRASNASLKAFVTNRVGDYGFMLAMFFIFGALGSLDYSVMNEGAAEVAESTATVIALLLLMAAMGKSAQILLHLWLPDAMEGPTPVSALIHAATMVTAGVFLVCRAHPFFEAAPDAAETMALVGGVTALLAGTIAIVQPDVKRVLAYSTVSQLGYMFMAAGVGAYSTAVFFMICHACYKGALFLGAGTVIHGSHDNQDLRTMGRYRRFMPATALGFIVAWLAISGIPPFAGFWAKDDVLADAWFGGHYVVYGLGLTAAFFTAFYMTRETWLVFFGNERFRPEGFVPGAEPLPVVSGGSDDLEPGHGEHDLTASPTVDYGTPPAPARLERGPHEGTGVMVLGVLILAAFAAVDGLLNLPFTNLEFLSDWLEPVFEDVPEVHPTSFVAGATLSIVAVVVVSIGLFVAWRVYRHGLEDPAVDPTDRRLGPLAKLFGHAYYYDEAVSAAVEHPGKAAGQLLTDEVDTKVIDGAVNGTGRLARLAAGGLRHLQTGYVRQYAVGIALGVVLVLLYALARAGIG